MGGRSGWMWAGSIAGALAVGGGAWWLWKHVTGARWTWGRPPSRDPWGELVYRDPAQVLPVLADKVELVLARMHARGHDAVVNEGWRSPARVQHLATEGTGSPTSLHPYGGAVDIVDRKLGWGASAAFKAALIEEVERVGLTSGHTFSTRDDWAHAQVVPVREEQAFRSGTLAERNRLAA